MGKGNKQQGHGGRFEGAYRVDVEDVPRLPTFPAAWTLWLIPAAISTPGVAPGARRKATDTVWTPAN
jgi:hypothetical protein